MSDEDKDGKKKRKPLSLNVGDIAGKVVKKAAAPKEDKIEIKEDKKKCDCPECASKPDVPKVDTIPFKEDNSEPIIHLNVKGKRVKLEDIGQEDFLNWIGNVMPMTEKKFQMLQKSDFSNYEERKKLFEAVAKYHEDAMKADLKNRGYSGFPLM